MDRKIEANIDNLKKISSNIHNINEISIPMDNKFFKLDNIENTQKFLVTIKKAKGFFNSKNIILNLAIDNVCTGGLSVTYDYRKQLFSFLEKIEEMNINVILSEPQLIDFVLKNFKNLNVIIYARSSHGILDFHIRSYLYTKVISKYRNVKRIILPCDLNRNFREIKLINETANCEVSLVVNEGDVFCSHFKISELSALSHISSFEEQGYYKRIEKIYQSKRDNIFKKKPWRLIASPWIRPEDLNFYEDLGIDCFTVLANNDLTRTKRIVKAYSNKEYDRNLLDILKYGSSLSKNINLSNNNLKIFLKSVMEKNGCMFDCYKCKICIKVGDGLA